MAIIALLPAFLASSIAFAQVAPGPVETVTMPNGVDKVTIRTAGKAKTWDDARKTCQQLGAGWDLPTDDDYLKLEIADRLPKFVYSDDEDPVFYGWIRGKTEKANEKYFTGRAKLYSENKSGDPDFLDIAPGRDLADIAARVEKTKAALKPEDTEKRADLEKVEHFLDSLKDGCDLVCVLANVQ